MITQNAERDRLLELLAQIKDGSDEAAWELVNNYSHHVRRAVRRRLPGTLRAKFDSLDFVQLTWLSFFRNSDQIVEVDQPVGFIRLLAKIAAHKVLDEVRKRGLAKYDISKEVVSADDGEGRRLEFSGKQDTPSQIVSAKESWENALRTCTPKEIRVVKLRQMGLTYDEIAEKEGIGRRSAIRIVSRLFREFVA